MADFRELFTSSDFAAYQDEIVTELAGWLDEEFKAPVVLPERVKAMLEISHLILGIPGKLKAPPDVEKKLQAAVKARLIAIPIIMLRKGLNLG